MDPGGCEPGGEYGSVTARWVAVRSSRHMPIHSVYSLPRSRSALGEHAEPPVVRCGSVCYASGRDERMPGRRMAVACAMVSRGVGGLPVVHSGVE